MFDILKCMGAMNGIDQICDLNELDALESIACCHAMERILADVVRAKAMRDENPISGVIAESAIDLAKDAGRRLYESNLALLKGSQMAAQAIEKARRNEVPQPEAPKPAPPPVELPPVELPPVELPPSADVEDDDDEVMPRPKKQKPRKKKR